jgi:hypothetical protein
MPLAVFWAPVVAFGFVLNDSYEFLNRVRGVNATSWFLLRHFGKEPVYGTASLDCSTKTPHISSRVHQTISARRKDVLFLKVI